VLQEDHKSLTGSLQECYKDVTRVLQGVLQQCADHIMRSGFSTSITTCSCARTKGVRESLTELLQEGHIGVTRVQQRCYGGVTWSSSASFRLPMCLLDHPPTTKSSSSIPTALGDVHGGVAVV
jgi:hypothetical protein